MTNAEISMEQPAQPELRVEVISTRAQKNNLHKVTLSLRKFSHLPIDQ
jgi:hypothetical protein